jgi:VIT1/CCC1 family predicted Fe2+/Mn2+ transporter
MSSSPLSPDEIRAAAAVHQELGPQYSDAVVESFLERIDKEIAARIEARFAVLPEARRRQPDQAKLTQRRTLLAGAAIGAVGAGAPLTPFAFSMADGQGRSQWLAAIWIVIGLVFVAAVAGAGTVRASQVRSNPERARR